MASLERVPQSPPIIPPVPEGVQRPLWSVMIPVYNSLPYLEQTIRSILAQDPGEDLMQIEVVDDISKDGDVAALVERVGQGRVQFYQQPVNVGNVRNFETCIKRARGHYVHLLHGDDYVEPCYYAAIQQLFEDFPEVDRKKAEKASRKNFAYYFAHLAHNKYHQNGDTEMAKIIAKDALRFQWSAMAIKKAILLYFKMLIRYKN